MSGWREPTLTPRTILGYIPITALAVAGICWAVAVAGIWGTYNPSFTRLGGILNPFYHATNLFIHFDWAHLRNNLRLWIPIAIVFTWLTSNRHLLVVIIGAHVSTNVVSAAVGSFVFGLSGVVFAVAAALTVRATGIAFQNQSADVKQTAVASALIVIGSGFFLIFLLIGHQDGIAHFAHFLGFVFGGAIEALYVLDTSESTDTDRTMPRGPRL